MPAIFCGDYTALAITNFGSKIYVDTRDTSLAPHLMIDGNWEPAVTNAIGLVLGKFRGAVFIDVGANFGWYTLVACARSAAHVFAYDPNPRMVELLRKTIAVNGLRNRVTLRRAACGRRTGLMRLIVDPEEMGGAHLQEPSAAFDTDGCTVIRLDDEPILARFPEGQIIMKVDVEGFEPQVIAGANDIILERRPILFLEHAQDESHREMLLSLQVRGYELRQIQSTGHRSAPLDLDAAMATGPAETILCAPEGLL